MLHQNLDHGVRVSDKILRVELQLFEFRIFSDKIFDRVFQFGDDGLKLLFSGRGLDVENNVVFNTEFAGDRQRVGGRASMRVMVDGNFAHATKDEALRENCNHGRLRDRRGGSDGIEGIPLCAMKSGKIISCNSTVNEITSR